MPLRRRMRSRRPMKKGRKFGKKRWARKPRASVTHLFKRQSTAFELTNTATQGVVATSDSNQIGLQTPVFESALSGGGSPYRFGAVSYFKLSNVLQSSDLTALYDRYKITGIKVKIIPLSNVANTNGQGVLPSMVYHVDYDDAQTPTADSDVRVKAGAKEVRLDRPRTIFIKPKIADAILGASAGTAYSVPKAAPYINMSYPDVPHYGLKMYFRDVNLSSSTGTSTNTCIRFETTYYIACKDPQ